MYKKYRKNFSCYYAYRSKTSWKTTVLKHITKNKKINYVTLDDLNIRALATENPELFLRTYEPALIIDEFQYAPNILPYIKIIIDNKREEKVNGENDNINGLFYLTGSQSFKIMEQTTESLAGRVRNTRFIFAK